MSLKMALLRKRLGLAQIKKASLRPLFFHVTKKKYAYPSILWKEMKKPTIQMRLLMGSINAIQYTWTFALASPYSLCREKSPLWEM